MGARTERKGWFLTLSVTCSWYQPHSPVCPSGPRTGMPGLLDSLSTGFRKCYKEIPAFFLAEARMWEERIHTAIFTFLQKS